jgi:hypothetical protein
MRGKQRAHAEVARRREGITMKNIVRIVLSSAAALGIVGCSAPASDEPVAETDEALALGTARERLTCESADNRYVTCPVNTHGGRILEVRVVRQISTPPGYCDVGQSFGSGPSYVWVDRGCRAEFDVMLQVPDLQSERIGCGSPDNGHRVCESNLTDIRSIRLVRQDSTAPCREGVSYGSYRDAIWVDQGCQGIFEVSGYGAASTGRVELFDRRGFGGRRYGVDRNVLRDLAEVGFSDRTESIIVYEGVWEACQNPDFWGLCQQFGPGRYVSLGQMGGSISSIRRLH